MIYLKTFENYGSYKRIIVCDDSVLAIVKSKFEDAEIHSKDSNSGIISTIKSLISSGKTNITFVINDSTERQSFADKRLAFIEEFMGKDDFSKVNVIKSSTL